MYLPLPTPQEMALWDRLSMEEMGIVPEILMENASREALNVIKYRFERLRGCSALVFAGSGNNGGDAFALARHLWNHDVKVMVLHSKRLKEYSAAAGYHLSLARKLDIPLMYLYEYNLDFLKRVDIIVDGLLGTGFSGKLRDDFVKWIKAINKLAIDSYVISLDIPSGIDGITGRPSPVAVKADDTVTFEEAKLGLLQPPARDYVGCLAVGKIGIPNVIKKENPPQHFGLSIRVLDQIARPRKTMHKGQAGHVLVVGGSQGLSGAAILSALGALRSGAGLVTVACPSGLAGIIRSGWPEIMVLPLGNEIQWHQSMLSDLEHVLHKFDSVVIGPGMGREDQTSGFVTGYLDAMHPKTIFDADALYFFARDRSMMKNLSHRQEVIFTPHPGEMGRFFNVSAAEINTDRTGFSRKFISEFGVNLVLKGACTIIAGKDSPLYVSPIAAPNLAIGGSGDILSGIIGSLLAQGLGAVDASNTGVYWHALAGQGLAKRYPFRGNLAREVADALPEVMARVRKVEENCFPDSLI